jgi:hypothetical protein
MPDNADVVQRGYGELASNDFVLVLRGYNVRKAYLGVRAVESLIKGSFGFGQDDDLAMA